MRENLFKGVTTALITPFNSDGSVDYVGLKTNVKHQIENGVLGLVPLGTTGETPTLFEEEKEQVVRAVVEQARSISKDVKILVGVGTNSTHSTIANCKSAQYWGADALLVVTPYYNKPTQEGIIAHFNAVCSAVDLPIVVYNIQGRTGTNIETGTLKKIAEANTNVIGVKEASGNLNQMMDVLENIPEIYVYSGDDGLTLPLLSLGGQGVISVVSNLLPARVVRMVQSALDGDYKTARAIHFDLQPIFKNAFIESNPAPIKYAMNKFNLAAGPTRLPLVEIRDSSKQVLNTILDKYRE